MPGTRLEKAHITLLHHLLIWWITFGFAEVWDAQPQV